MQRQLGFNLIEVMVALVVLSLGVLGMAALQLTSIQQNQGAYMRSQATILAYDLADRMRLNHESRDTYLRNAAGVQEPDCNTNVGCDTGDMVEHDLFEWYQLLGQELPSGGGLICRSDLQGDQVNPAPVPDCEADDSDDPIVVYVWWAEKDGSFTMTSVSTEVSD